MHYAIIAAGEGSRLRQEGVKQPKPLIKLGKQTMIDRLIEILLQNKAETLSIIVNEQMEQVQEHIRSKKLPIPLNLVIKTTPSSMHSFYELSKNIKTPVTLTTVDTIFDPLEFKQYITYATEKISQYDGIMGVTTYVDDEKPLWVKTDSDNKIINFLDQNDGTIKYVSGGIYTLRDKAIETLGNSMKKGIERMRNYQRELIKENNKLKAWNFLKIMDIDHVEDIQKAQRFLQL